MLFSKKHKTLLLSIIGMSILMASPHPTINKGVLDLREWTAFDHTMHLAGDWAFYWEEFVSPDRMSLENSDPDGYMSVPRPWNGFEIHGEQISGYGYGTYYLRILTPQGHERLMVHIPALSTSYDMYVNGQKVAKTGIAGETKTESKAEYYPQLVPLNSESDTLDIVFHISNFQHSQGGIWDHITLGTERVLENEKNQKIAISLIIAGTLIVLGLYHLAMFAIYEYTRSPFFLGILSIVLGIRSLITGEMPIYSFTAAMPWEFLIRIEYLTVVCGIMAFAFYQYDLFREYFNKSFLRSFLVFCTGYALVILLTPAFIFSILLNYFLIFVMIMLIYTLYVNIIALARKHKQALGFMIAYIVLMIAFLNDTLYGMEVINTGYYSAFGVMAFIAIQVVVLSLRFTNAFRTIDNQVLELNSHREKLEDLVKERTKELESANAQLRQLSTIDALTQIPNRRRLDEYINTEWSRLKRDGKPMSIIMLDIDFFKKYNDHYGHQMGDDCLIKVAKTLKNSVHRPADLVARYGGEEFCVVLPNTPVEGAEIIATMMLVNIQDLKIPHEKSEAMSVVTISIGVAEMTPSNENNPGDLMKLADKRLYGAKTTGRNRVVYQSET